MKKPVKEKQCPHGMRPPHCSLCHFPIVRKAKVERGIQVKDFYLGMFILFAPIFTFYLIKTIFYDSL